jgi:predicted Zn-dependent protease
MPFAGLDRGALARALAQLVDGADDLVEGYLERLEVVEQPVGGGPPGVCRWREEGLAVRIVRGDRTWAASRDRLDGAAFADAARQVARVVPRAALPVPLIDADPWPAPARVTELEELPRRIDRLLRERRVAFPYRLALRRHQRDLQVLGPQLVPGPERETFYSYTAHLDSGSLGGLLVEVGDDAAEAIAGRLADAFRAREAAPPEAGRTAVVLGPGAAAILLHEAVAHALEADTLAESGSPEAVRGLRLCDHPIDVLDDPGGAPHAVRRRTDDEGIPVTPRWLVRRGVVDQPLADQRWARRYAALAPGAGRRASRHHLPGPRSSYLRLLPGDGTLEDLLVQAGDGLYLPEAASGRLDPRSGAFTLEIPYGRRIREGALRETVGPCVLRGRLTEVLSQLCGVAGTAHVGGAGWCAKAGQKLPVFAASPEVLLAAVEVGPP